MNNQLGIMANDNCLPTWVFQNSVTRNMNTTNTGFNLITQVL